LIQKIVKRYCFENEGKEYSLYLLKNSTKEKFNSIFNTMEKLNK